jgi:hypothetical protein
MAHLEGGFPYRVCVEDIMANPEEQPYTEIVRQAQDAMVTLLDTWTRTFQQALSAAAPVNPGPLIDQTFDSAGKLVNAQLNAQRQFAKQMAASGAAAAKTAQTGAAQVTEALWGGSVL